MMDEEAKAADFNGNEQRAGEARVYARHIRALAPPTDAPATDDYRRAIGDAVRVCQRMAISHDTTKEPAAITLGEASRIIAALADSPPEAVRMWAVYDDEMRRSFACFANTGAARDWAESAPVRPVLVTITPEPEG
jgi:hypothetical protein